MPRLSKQTHRRTKPITYKTTARKRRNGGGMVMSSRMMSPMFHEAVEPTILPQHNTIPASMGVEAPPPAPLPYPMYVNGPIQAVVEPVLPPPPPPPVVETVLPPPPPPPVVETVLPPPPPPPVVELDPPEFMVDYVPPFQSYSQEEQNSFSMSYYGQRKFMEFDRNNQWNQYYAVNTSIHSIIVNTPVPVMDFPPNLSSIVYRGKIRDSNATKLVNVRNLPESLYSLTFNRCHIGDIRSIINCVELIELTFINCTFVEELDIPRLPDSIKKLKIISERSTFVYNLYNLTNIPIDLVEFTISSKCNHNSYPKCGDFNVAVDTLRRFYDFQINGEEGTTSRKINNSANSRINNKKVNLIVNMITDDSPEYGIPATSYDIFESDRLKKISEHEVITDLAVTRNRIESQKKGSLPGRTPFFDPMNQVREFVGGKTRRVIRKNRRKVGKSRKFKMKK